MIDLTQPSGPAVTTTQLAQAVGLSARTIRWEIRLGELKAGELKPPSGRVKFLIPWTEARRWAIRIGVIRGVA